MDFAALENKVRAAAARAQLMPLLPEEFTQIADALSQGAALMTGRDMLLRLIALNGYEAYRLALPHLSPIGKESFERAVNPKPGDLVLERTTIWRWKHVPGQPPGAAMGILLRIEQEPVVTQDKLDEMHAAGDCWVSVTETLDEIPKETVFYVAPFDGSVPEYRWTNASFIALKSDAL